MPDESERPTGRDHTGVEEPGQSGEEPARVTKSQGDEDVAEEQGHTAKERRPTEERQPAHSYTKGREARWDKIVTALISFAALVVSIIALIGSDRTGREQTKLAEKHTELAEKNHELAEKNTAILSMQSQLAAQQNAILAAQGQSLDTQSSIFQSPLTALKVELGVRYGTTTSDEPVAIFLVEITSESELQFRGNFTLSARGDQDSHTILSFPEISSRDEWNIILAPGETRYYDFNAYLDPRKPVIAANSIELTPSISGDGIGDTRIEIWSHLIRCNALLSECNIPQNEALLERERLSH